MLNDAAWIDVLEPVDADVLDAGPIMPTDVVQTIHSVTVLFGSESGASEDLARVLGREAIGRGLEATVLDLADFSAEMLANIDMALFICSTTGDGEPPYAAEDFFRQIADVDAPSLGHLRYAVLALGDSTYAQFCAAGRRLDDVLAALGAQRLLPRVDCDLDYEEAAEAWRAAALNLLTGRAVTEAGPTPAFYLQETAPRKQDLVEAVVIESRVLTCSPSTKATRHLALAFSDDEISYEPGDALGIVVENDPSVVAEVLRVGGLAGDTPVSWKNLFLPLEEVLRVHCEITTATPRFIEAWSALGGCSELSSLVPPADKRVAFMREHHIVDLMRRYPASAIEPQTFVQMLRPLQPRLYSIASSSSAAPGEVHLTIAPVAYELHGEPRSGVATGQLCGRAPIGARLQVYVQPNPHFRLPAADVPIVMIGAGTGIAPYRGFLQERARQPRRGPAWLFFGERNRATDFLYEAEFEAFLADATLTSLDTAFSRDAAEKTYVQHRMIERADELAGWMRDGAHVYVCGDAMRMAPDVHQALIQVIERGLGLTQPAAESYLANMQRQGRYQRDVY